MTVDHPTDLTIVTLIPSLLDTNGDAANARVLAQRARWAGLSAVVVPVEKIADLPEAVDLVVIGSGTDTDLLSARDALTSLAEPLRAWLAGGVPVLAVGTGWELLSAGLDLADGTSIDGIQVGGATGLTVENSWVGGFGQGEGSDVHADCVQLFDSSDIVLRGNYFGGCDNAALIFSPGAGTGIRAVTVEGNFLQGCVNKDDERCSQGTALDLRANTTDVVVRNNTMLDGSVMVEPLPGLVFDRNIVGYASNCAMPMTNSIVIAWNTGKCDTPDAVGSAGNRVGAVEVADRAAGDLSPVDPAQVLIEPEGGSSAPSGFAGGALSDDQAGAGG